MATQDREKTAHEYQSPVRIGIALSGGGIRSAIFCLGACQRFMESGVFGRARYLAAVSGGSYLAGAMAISHAFCPENLWDAEPVEWGRGSREEAHLRSNLSYLAPGSLGRTWLVANVLYGLILNLFPLALAAGVTGRLVGVGLRWIYPRIGTPGVEFTAMMWVAIAIAVTVVASLGVVAVRRFRDARRGGGLVVAVSRSERIVVVLLSVGVAIGIIGIVLPVVVDVVGLATDGRILKTLDLRTMPWTLRRVVVGLIALSAMVALGTASLLLLRARRLPITRNVAALILNPPIGW